MHLSHFIELQKKQLEDFGRSQIEFNRMAPSAFPLQTKDGVEGWMERFASFCEQQRAPSKHAHKDLKTVFAIAIPKSKDNSIVEYWTADNKLQVFENAPSAYTVVLALNQQQIILDLPAASVKVLTRADEILLDEHAKTIAVEEEGEWIPYED